MEVDRPVQQLRFKSPCTCVTNESFCLVSMMSGREKRDLNEGKWGVGLKNKFLKSSVKWVPDSR